jgi:hypothetical protein
MPMTVLHAGISNVGVSHAGMTNVGVLHAGRVLNGSRSPRPPWEAAMVLYTNVYFIPTMLNRFILAYTPRAHTPGAHRSRAHTHARVAFSSVLNRLIGGSCMALDWRLLHASLPLSHCLHLVAYGPS